MELVVERLGRSHTPMRWAAEHGWGSEYFERFWLPTLGPSSFVVGQRLDRWLGDSSRAVLPWGSLHFDFGLGARRLELALDRLAKFHLVRFEDDLLVLPSGVPSLSTRLLDRLPPRFGVAHRAGGFRCVDSPQPTMEVV